MTTRINFIGKVILIGHFMVAAAFSTVVEERCRGGEGPKPFIDLGSYAPSIRKIRTIGSVSEFFVWEDKDAILFRNNHGEIFGNFLEDKQMKYYGMSDYPLAKVSDSQQSTFLALGLGRIWNAVTGSWKPFGPKNARLEHMFFKNKVLYSMEEAPTVYGNDYRFYKYGAGDSGQLPFCTYPVTGKKYGVAHGSVFPYVFLHSVATRSTHQVLIIEKLDLTTCQIVKEFNYTPMPVEGAIKDVYRYDDIDAVAAVIDHPTKNLLWDDGKECKFYNVQSDEIVPLHTNDPMFAIWAKEDGMSILNLKGSVARQAKIVNVMPIERMTFKDFWLTQDRTRLYFSPRLNNTPERPILEISLD